MTERRELGVVTDYAGLMAAINARVAELNVTRETLDAVSGLQSGYTAKLLAPVPIRSLGPVSFGAMLQALGLALVVIEDPKAPNRHYEPRSRVRSVGRDEVISLQITRRKLGFLGRKGGKMRAQNMTPKQRARAAKRAARARWGKARNGGAAQVSANGA